MITTSTTYKYERASVLPLKLNDTVYQYGSTTFKVGKVIGFQGKKAVVEFDKRKFQVPIYLRKSIEVLHGMYPKYVTRNAKDIPDRCRKNALEYKEGLLQRKKFQTTLRLFQRYKSMKTSKLYELNQELTKLLEKYE